MCKILGYLSLLISLFFQRALAQTDDSFKWANGEKIAISLSYEDALDSQLDNALPSLNKHNFRASFYLLLTYSTISERLSDWRKVASQGHELGNHSIFHPCRASLLEREWVEPHKNLDNYSVEQIREE